MLYNIRRLDMHTPQRGVYFFDANIWLLVLGIETAPNQKQSKYIQFFQRVIATGSTVLISAQLMSEVVNKMLLVEMKKFALKKGDKVESTYYKQVFRYSPEFAQKLQSIYDDIKIYGSSCKLINDNFGNDQFGLDDLLVATPPIIEFNDHYFAQLAKHYSAVCVTDDGDFFIKDLEILTLNNALINKANTQLTISKTE